MQTFTSKIKFWQREQPPASPETPATAGDAAAWYAFQAGLASLRASIGQSRRLHRIATSPNAPRDLHAGDVARSLQAQEEALAKAEAEAKRIEQTDVAKLEAKLAPLEAELAKHQHRRDSLMEAIAAPDTDAGGLARLAGQLAQAEQRVSEAEGAMGGVQRLLSLKRGAAAASVQPAEWRERGVELTAQLAGLKGEVATVQELLRSPAVASDATACGNLAVRLRRLQTIEEAITQELAAIQRLEQHLARGAHDASARAAIAAVDEAQAAVARAIAEVAGPLAELRSRLISAQEASRRAAQPRGARGDAFFGLEAMRSLTQAETALRELSERTGSLTTADLLGKFDAAVMQCGG